MKNKIKLLGSALGLALLASTASAALVLSGNTAGAFQPQSNPYTTIVNSPDGMSASIRTGVPHTSSDFKSGITFAGDTFSNITSGSTFSIGMFTYYNGITNIGTASDTAYFDLYVNLTDPSLGSIFLTTIKFGIDATPNTPGSVPDLFFASFTQPSVMLIGDTWVKFTINDLPAETAVNENTWKQLANVTVTYLTPVPEPSTYGLMGAAGLLGLVGYRRYRAKRANVAV